MMTYLNLCKRQYDVYIWYNVRGYNVNAIRMRTQQQQEQNVLNYA